MHVLLLCRLFHRPLAGKASVGEATALLRVRRAKSMETAQRLRNAAEAEASAAEKAEAQAAVKAHRRRAAKRAASERKARQKAQRQVGKRDELSRDVFEKRYIL